MVTTGAAPELAIALSEAVNHPESAARKGAGFAAGLISPALGGMLTSGSLKSMVNDMARTGQYRYIRGMVNEQNKNAQGSQGTEE